jgi:hypothetical protein
MYGFASGIPFSGAFPFSLLVLGFSSRRVALVTMDGVTWLLFEPGYLC